MKKTALLLALLLTLSGCQPAAPVEAQNGGSASSAAEESAPASGPADEDTREDPAPQADASYVDAPEPDEPPQTTVGAIELPAEPASSDAGYSVDLLTPAQYDLYYPLNRGGYRQFQTADFFPLGQGGKYAVANRNGRLLTNVEYELGIEGWNSIDGMVPLKKDGKAGAIDAADGSVLVPFEYDDVWCASGSDGSGLYRVQKGDAVEMIDRTGVTRFSMERGDDFTALKKRFVLYKDGMLRFYNQQYSPIANFACDGMEVVSSPRTNEGGRDLIAFDYEGAWGLADSDGKFLTDPVYDEIGYFTGSYAVVTQNGKRGIINDRGKVVVKPEWDDITLYKSSASVCKDNRWGVITDIDSGEPAVKPSYDYIMGFGDYGYACFERNGKFGIMDKEGNEIVPARYDGTLSTSRSLDKGYYILESGDGPFNSGIVDGRGRVIIPTDHYVQPGADGEKLNLVLTPSGKWGFANDRGQFVIDAQFENASPFISGKNVAFVQKDGKICLVNRKGELVLKTVFSDLIGYNPDTMVCAMEYTAADGTVKGCLVKVNLPA
ncbi:WG repeat-containing protein [Anaerotruncus sp. DFI.9.16]|uniref:WG repeat-containing protein n=1 Tax=Anaerotruncus sp. DFI.9.16 TaxID=2965275 RepID=UPI00210BB232|nr:WG repeat-containing protein [Anaerotruncus sp. DFI.9.16]MCQ4896572.1 WG repeat-containing protein [Anaerotruncus sp. DFI.9.16]